MDPAIPKPSSRTGDGGRRFPVDFQGDDGLLHSGKLVCGTENGILVEARTGKYAGSTQLVPYGKVYHCERSARPDLVEEMETQDGRMVVEVLARLDADQPMQWYPAVLLQCDDGKGTFGVASIVQSHSTVTVVVPANRIRTRFTDWVAVTQQECRELAAATHERESDENGIRLLPAVLLAEIFECLDTPVRCRYRRVCSHWNGVLTMPRHHNQLRLSYSGRINSEEEEKEGRLEEAYLNAVCASKCWASTVIIIGPEFPAVTFCRMVQELGLRPPRVIFVSGLRWNKEWSDDMTKEINTLASVGQKLVLRNVILVVHDKNQVVPEIILRIISSRMREDQQLSEKEWCKIVGNSLSALTEIELTGLLDRIDHVYRQEFGEVNWTDVHKGLLEVSKDFADLVDWCGDSQITIQLQNPSARDLVKLELQKMPTFWQHFYLALVNRSAVLEATISF